MTTPLLACKFSESEYVEEVYNLMVLGRQPAREAYWQAYT